MSKSLRDQLVAAGLANKSKARKAEKQARAEAQRREKQAKTARTDPRTGKTLTDEEVSSRQRARQAQYEKVARDRELAKARNEKAAERALRAEIKQLIKQNDQRELTPREDDVGYNFVHNKKIKRIHVTPKQVDQLSSGSLAIVNDDGTYHLVSKQIADKIAERDPRRFIVDRSKSDGSSEEPLDDDYKGFEIPDDLDW